MPKYIGTRKVIKRYSGLDEVIKSYCGTDVTYEETSEPDYFCIENVYDGNNTICFASNPAIASGAASRYSLEYSLDGKIWQSYGTIIDVTQGRPVKNLEIILSANDKVYFRNTTGMFNAYSNGYSSGQGLQIDSTQDFKVSGDIRTLLDYRNVETLVYPDYCFINLFGSSKVVDASELKLSKTQTSKYCYSYLFSGTSSRFTKFPDLNVPMSEYSCRNMFNSSAIIVAPVLPATTLAKGCYYRMFYSCSKLETGPSVLPALTLESECYCDMFTGCKKLIETPRILAEAMQSNATYSLSGMFSNCTLLTTVHSLHLSNLGRGSACYNMFSGCTSLVTVPNDLLPATTLADSCYRGMFSYCTSLVNAPVLPATTLASNCYDQMFYNCTSLVNAPSLPATDLPTYCYLYMFYGCVNLETIPAIPATSYSVYYGSANQCQGIFYGCSKIKISTVQDDEYTNSYHIFTNSYSNIWSSAFTNTGGTFTGTPTSNTTYYTSNTVV